MGFTKLDEGILTSSVMAEPSDVFKVWIAFLAAVDPDGIARVTVIFLSGVCHLPLEAIETAIRRLEAPDPYSRTKDYDGRRILPVDGGWFVVNYEKYRLFNYSMKVEAVRKRAYRDRMREGQNRDNVPKCPGHSASASASDSDSNKREEEKEEEIALFGKVIAEINPDFEDKVFAAFWEAYPREGRHAKIESRKKFRAIVKRGELEEFRKGFRGYMKFLERQKVDRGFEQTPMYAKTFLNDRWREFVGYDPKPKL